ncbi:MAG TPA: hypothetical protein H9811_04250 [Candidatus Gemmiger excrementigallinarum]|uniref:Bacterial repeat domain-containing protein n=1 Tax=Candidatus Gemmiger excrementigallinarum TaxID=2838609 RepID=A0A9D2EQ33_9FIRM|nr:hypothetical protein [Candidatus Gemmiger excrementigallinarum]
MKLAGQGKKVLSLALAAAMAVSLCATGWAESADSTVTVGQGPAATSETAQSDAEEMTEEPSQPMMLMPKAQPRSYGTGFCVSFGMPAVSTTVPESAAVARVEKDGGTLYYASLSEAMAAAQDGTVTLLKDVSEEVAVPANVKATLELNGKTLTMCNTKSVVLANGADLAIRNGSIVAKQMPNGTTPLFNIQANSSISLNKVQLDTNGAALFPQGDAAIVEVTDSYVIGGCFAVATNAEKVDNYSVKIVLKESCFDCRNYGYNPAASGDGCAVMINVPGTMEIDGCTITGSRQGMLVRGGTATVRNSSITTTGQFAEGIGKYLDSDWSSGDEVPMAALVVGNRSHEYLYPVTCVVENTTIDSYNPQVPAIYTYGMGTDDLDVPLTIDGENSKVQGEISNNGAAKTTISAGYYTEMVPKELIAEGKGCNLLETLYQDLYAYQVAEPVEDVADGVIVQPEEPEAEVNRISEDELPDIEGVDKKELADEINTVANAINVSEESKDVVSNSVLIQAEVDGHKVNSQAAREIAKEALQEKVASGDELKQNAEIIITVTPVLKVEPKAPVTNEENRLTGVSFDIKLVYTVTASAETTGGHTVTAAIGEEKAVADPPVMDMTIPNIPVSVLGYEETDPAEAIASDLYVRHEHEGSVFYYNTIVTKEQGQGQNTVSVSFTNEHGFSVFTVGKYSDKATVQYPWGNIEYVVTDIGTALPTAAKDGYTFKGWTFAGVAGGPYLTMTEELLGKLAQTYSAAGSNAVAASAVFSQNVSDVDKEEEVGSQPAATPAPTAAPQQSGSNITYYTCPACGYHDWTATAEGYKCNHCGYLESVKQLSGYGNVKGVYEPKTSAAAAASAGNSVAASAIPQTSDDLPLTALIVVAIAALVGLGIVVVMKKRNKH